MKLQSRTANSSKGGTPNRRKVEITAQIAGGSASPKLNTPGLAGHEQYEGSELATTLPSPMMMASTYAPPNGA